MRLRPSLFAAALAGALGLVAACGSPRPAATPPRPATAPTAAAPRPADAPPPGAPPPGAPRPDGAPGAPRPGGGGTPADGIRTRLGDRVAAPATEVFQNVKVLTALSAGQLLNAMEGFNQALGVRCSFCHVPGQWASDAQEEKGVARGMVTMTHRLNETGLREAGVGGATVSCWTCHRGRAHPEALGGEPHEHRGGDH